MGKFSKWTEIENLYKVPEILSLAYAKEVVATEKIHGTSVRVGCVEDVIRVGGRNEEFDFALSNPGASMGFVGWLRQTQIPEKIQKLAKELGKDIIFYGEWHGVGIQRGIKYLPDGRDFRVFGVRINEDIQDWDVVVELSTKIGVRTVPVLYRGIPNMEIFDQLRIIPSMVAKENGIDLADNIAEGIVVSAIPMQQLGQSWLIAKYKNPKFEERVSQQKKEHKPLEISDSAVCFVEEFWTLQRLEHILTYLREQGIDIQSPKVIGLAIKGMFEDVIKEGRPEWEALPEEAQRAATKLHPTRTKELLETFWREELS